MKCDSQAFDSWQEAYLLKTEKLIRTQQTDGMETIALGLVPLCASEATVCFRNAFYNALLFLRHFKQSLTVLSESVVIRALPYHSSASDCRRLRKAAPKRCPRGF